MIPKLGYCNFVIHIRWYHTALLIPSFDEMANVFFYYIKLKSCLSPDFPLSRQYSVISSIHVRLIAMSSDISNLFISFYKSYSSLTIDTCVDQNSYQSWKCNHLRSSGQRWSHCSVFSFKNFQLSSFVQPCN